MKKVVRTIWISLLTGLAFLVACTSPKGLTRAEKKQLKAERTDIIAQIEQQRQESQNVKDAGIMMTYKNTEMNLRQRLSDINIRLGDTDAEKENGQYIVGIQSEMDSLQAVIDASHDTPACVYGPPISARRLELQERLDSIRKTIRFRESACVYGSPEVMQKYKNETIRLRHEADSIQQLINEIDNE